MRKQTLYQLVMTNKNGETFRSAIYGIKKLAINKYWRLSRTRMFVSIKLEVVQ